MAHFNSCPLCLSENISLKFSCTDHFISKEVFNVASCKDCGFEFTQDSPAEKDIGRYYESDDYISHSNTSKGLFNKLYFMARSIMLRRKLLIIQKATGLKTGHLLDIGSGTGFFANAAKMEGWQVKGIEINDKARNYSISNFGLDISGPDEISKTRTGSFDCITLWHVLEHFHNPFEYAAEINRLLKPDGVCVIALPNCRSYDAEHYGSYWAAYDVPRHLWHFSPASFRLFAEKTGFRLISVKTLPLDVFYISALSEKYNGSAFSFIKGMLRASMFTFLTLFNKGKSSSVIYILRKSNSDFKVV